MYDGSLRCQTKRAGEIVSSSRDYSCELVSPILTYDEDINNLQEIVRLLRKAGGFTNPTCGIHIHINGADHDWRSIRNFNGIIKTKDCYAMQRFQHQANRGRFMPQLQVY